ncbi:hypothetical protein AB4Z45_18710 [Paenibacillus sp. MCAF9]|uniref:hypothetical protein n=1 Tax=Paenibacillus sp. MCAF9 TaxID=3233046 RepID=UPI003F9828D5
MEQSSIIMLLSALGVISGITIGWLGRNRTARQDVKAEAGEDAILRTDVKYIMRGVDEVRLEQRAQGKRFDMLSERVTRVEESAKQAHNRIDRLDSSTIKIKKGV